MKEALSSKEQKRIEYSVWHGMIRRCHNTRDSAFLRYGGSGITVCDRWRQNFSAFVADMGHRPGRDWQIHRTDSTQGYKPENCQWVRACDHPALDGRGLLPPDAAYLVGLYQLGDFTYCALAAGFGIGRKTVSRLVNKHEAKGGHPWRNQE